MAGAATRSSDVAETAGIFFFRGAAFCGLARPGLAESAGRADREARENSRIAPNRAGRGEKSRIAVVKQHATQRRE